MQIIDSHAHIFPYFGSPTGYGSHELRMTYLQRSSASAASPNTRRASDHARMTVPREAFWDPTRPGPRGRRDVRLRVGRHGRVESSYDGVDCYVQTFPPLLESMTADADTLIALMDWAGVDVAVLQNDHIYGSLNSFFTEAVNRYPDRLVGLIQVDEANLDAREQHLLVDSARDSGLSGMYYKTQGLFLNDCRDTIDSERFFPFWSKVESARLPVYWDISPVAGTPESSLQELRQLENLLVRFPGIPGVLHGGVLKLFRPLAHDLDTAVPEELARLIENHDIRLELLYPIFCGGRFDYPYPELRDTITGLYRRFGPEKLVWGSDAPNVERNCTYRQSWTFLTDYYPEIPTKAMELIMGGNLRSLFELQAVA